MKKSLLALAVLSAFAGAASAQTNITVYGIVDAAVTYDNSGAGRNWTLDSSPAGGTNQSGSRLGFKGTEDLGSGTSAIFLLENGFGADDGTLKQGGRLFGRQAWVGLKADFGEVKLGRQLSPLYSALDQVDPFRIGFAGNAQRAFGYGLYGSDPLARIDNSVSYSITTSGVTAIVDYGFGEQAGAFSNNRTVAAGVGYANGPINVQLVYQSSNTVGLATGATTTTAAAAGSPAVVFGATTAGTGIGATTAASDRLRTAFIGGYYDLGVAKVHLAYGDTKVDSTAGSVKDRNWMLGVSAPVGPAGNVMASWNRNDVRDIAGGKSNQYALGYTHALSKRTDLYTSLAYTRNDSNVRLNSTAIGQSDRLFNVGVRHLF